jgi:hypothetical protein
VGERKKEKYVTGALKGGKGDPPVLKKNLKEICTILQVMLKGQSHETNPTKL